MLPRFKAARITGRMENYMDEKKVSDMMEYDAATVVAFAGRFGGKLFAPNPNYDGPEGLAKRRRLLPNTTYDLFFRVAAGKKPGTKKDEKILRVAVKGIRRKKEEDAKPLWMTREKHAKDPDWRRIRGAAKFLAGAFTNTQLPPRRRRGKAQEEE